MKKAHEIEEQERIILAYGAYTQIAASLQHYNLIQTTYRTFISTWLLATYVGIGYSLSSLETNLPFDPLIVVSFICLASSTAVFLVWYLDLIICEQSIAALVMDGLDLEKEHEWLPGYYQNVSNLKILFKYINTKSLFYIGCLSILFLTFGSSIALYLFQSGNRYYYLFPLFSLFLILASTLVLHLTMKRNDPYLRIKRIKRRLDG